MATAVVSGRVDDRIRERANAHIHAAGLTVGDVIKAVWENIAETGEVPTPAKKSSTEEQRDPMAAFYALRKELSEHSGKDDWLHDLTREQMRNMIEEGLMEKYGYA